MSSGQRSPPTVLPLEHGIEPPKPAGEESGASHQAMANESTLWKSFKNFLAGTLGGFSGKLIEYPFDTLKVRLQSQLSGAAGVSQFEGPLDCLVQTVRSDGFLGLYKGMSPALVGTMLETSVLFSANSATKDLMRPAGMADEALPMHLIFSSGLVAGVAATAVLTPIELIKIRCQMQNSPYRGPMHCLFTSVRQEGAAVLYRGVVPTLLREAPGTACWFGMYETVLRALTPTGVAREDVSPLATITAGAAGGMAYWLVPYPADTVKSAIQSGRSAGEHRFVPALMNVFRQSGFRGLYSGVSTTLLRAAPANAAIFWVYEMTMQAMRDNNW